jgi:hypothetical protein
MATSINDHDRIKKIVIKILNEINGINIALEFSSYDYGVIRVLQYRVLKDDMEIRMIRYTDKFDERLLDINSPSYKTYYVDVINLIRLLGEYSFTARREYTGGGVIPKDKADMIDNLIQHLNYLISGGGYNNGLERLFVYTDCEPKQGAYSYMYTKYLKGDAQDVDPSILKIAAGLDYELKCKGIVSLYSHDPSKLSMAVRAGLPGTVYAVTVIGDNADDVLRLIDEDYNGEDSEVYGMLYDIASAIRRYNLYAKIDI